MTTVAIIPARGGSKGVPGKNLRRIGGIPLIGRAVRACRATHGIDHIFVTTDDAAIAAAGAEAGAQVIWRPAELASDIASSEDALLHALEECAEQGIDVTTLVFVQCTSPFIRGEEIDRAIELVTSGEADSVFSGIETFEFLWRESPDSPGDVVGQNHDASHRPLRQEREPDYRETGAFYVMRADGFREHRHRFFGRTKVVTVSELDALEIDTAEELALADAFSHVLDRGSADDPHVATPIDVDAVVTDFDGVHTPDTVYVDQDGVEQVRVSRSDGMGVSFLRKADIPLLILSKEVNPVVTARAAKLKVDVAQGVDDKATAIKQWMAERGLDPARVAYVGNDVNDLAPMAEVGWPVAVPEAHQTVLDSARVILSRPGGGGAVRELCERVLAARPDSAPQVAPGTHWHHSTPTLALGPDAPGARV